MLFVCQKGGYKRGLAKKLKNLKITSVDFVDEGANQRANINLFKRKEPEDKPQESMFKRFVNWLKGEGMDDAQIEAEIEKAAVSFKEQLAQRNTEEIDEEIWNVTSALRSSLYSIVADVEMDAAEKPAAMTESVSQFTVAIQEYIPKWCSGQSAVSKDADDTETSERLVSDYQRLGAMVGKLKKEDPDSGGEDDDDDENEGNNEKGDFEKMLKIDKSKMTPEEVTAYEEIVKKYAVEEPDDQPGTDPVSEDVEKAKETAPAAQEDPVESEIVKALKAQIEETKKSLNAMKDEALTKDVTEVAKKYVPLGKKVEELVPVLKQMKAAGDELYNNYVALLDQQLDIQKSSGIFTEIGKSTTGDASGDPEKMWIAKAKELQKTKTDLTLQQAMDEVALNDDELRAQLDQ